jgi:hypothetical protein
MAPPALVSQVPVGLALKQATAERSATATPNRSEAANAFYDWTSPIRFHLKTTPRSQWH